MIGNEIFPPLSMLLILRQKGYSYITHILRIFGCCGLILAIITGLVGINLDGIPRAEGSYVFALSSGILFSLGAVLIAIG